MNGKENQDDHVFEGTIEPKRLAEVLGESFCWRLHKDNIVYIDAEARPLRLALIGRYSIGTPSNDWLSLGFLPRILL